MLLCDIDLVDVLEGGHCISLRIGERASNIVLGERELHTDPNPGHMAITKTNMSRRLDATRTATTTTTSCTTTRRTATTRPTTSFIFIAAAVLFPDNLRSLWDVLHLLAGLGFLFFCS